MGRWRAVTWWMRMQLRLGDDVNAVVDNGLRFAILCYDAELHTDTVQTTVRWRLVCRWMLAALWVCRVIVLAGQVRDSSTPGNSGVRNSGPNSITCSNNNSSGSRSSNGRTRTQQSHRSTFPTSAHTSFSLLLFTCFFLFITIFFVVSPFL